MDQIKASISDNIKVIKQRIASAAERCGRNAGEITLVAVTKTHPVEAALSALETGVLDLGENRVQEALEKIEIVSSKPEGAEVRWHLIGHLQTNKARFATGRFDLIHSLSSQRLADGIQKTAKDLAITQKVLIQMNISEEDSKSGLYTSLDARKLTAHVLERCPNLSIEGLMTIAAPCDNPEDVRDTFKKLRSMRDELRDEYAEADWKHLSMGMTGDLEVAVEEGATLVRVGSAIFGDRTSSQ